MHRGDGAGRSGAGRRRRWQWRRDKGGVGERKVRRPAEGKKGTIEEGNEGGEGLL